MLDNEILRLGFDGIKAHKICIGSTDSSSGGIEFYIGGKKVPEQKHITFSSKFYGAKMYRGICFQEKVKLTHSSRIPEELCDIIQRCYGGT